MGFVLNCSGRDNTLITLSKGFRCTVPELKMVLLDIDLEKVFTADPHIPKTANQLLFEYTINNLTEPDELISAFWFHGTRTVADNHFPDGILPLNRSFAAVIRMLADAAPSSQVRTRLSDWEKSGVPDRMFMERHGNSIHWGPYASLIREAQLNNEVTGHRNYTKMPELVEDVCNAYMKQYGSDIKAHYAAILKPKLIWFSAPPNDSRRCIEAALAYAYTTVRHQPPDSCANWGIDREGVAVPPENIIRIEKII
ncbi:hypothetical protein L400_02694 [Enterobacter hormaechei]|uniref:hypothetical protein n=1 Tax=Enterobacter cloacae complex TaxID=354276 RepID=UPI0003BE1BFD|nr:MULTISPECIES: hypothetical protein [Enterobacter cloacae complex]MBT1769605.1 hypothetical protein [Enterobacter hormaechei subsp. xiangfangensis]HBN5336836.1 hypothetical protein [Enterobacter cloacae]HDC4770067.1 hypothetical protein [Enterobacter asburiae]ESM46347.1 hypothetical protein L400_02694 [Enterobacter hormaechei]KJM39696.1 hypothetical protein SS27_01570 [Enterobacter kobei]